MSARPVWRWKGFWLGVCVLAFLGWAWVSSVGRESGVGWQWETTSVWAGRGYAVGQGAGEAYVEWGIYDPSAENGLSHWSYETRKEGVSCPKAVTLEGRVVTVAHWFMALVFFLVWSGWMVWRWRREKFASVQCGVLREEG